MPKSPPTAEQPERELDRRVASYLEAAERSLAEGKTEEALGFERLAKDEADRRGSPPSPEHAAIDAAAAERLRSEGLAEQALERYDAALAAHSELGLEDRRTFALTYGAGVTAREAGKAERAVRLFGEAIELASRRYGDTYLPSVPARVALAHALIRVGRLDEAGHTLDQALLVCRRAGPAGARSSALVREAIAALRGETGASDDAADERAHAADEMKEAEDRRRRHEPGKGDSRLAEELEVIEGPDEAEKPEDVLRDLDERLVGLGDVKAQFRRLANLLTVQARRSERGRKTAERHLDLIMVGPPGTGKTTVASYLGRLCRSLNLLETGDVVVVTRAQLVRGHVGQTAIRTNEVIDFALDKVLFIDEAYSLAPPEAANDFGPEAIAELMVRMERDSDRLVVALAGYPAEMERFLETNSGLRSRFTDTLEFSHYEAAELGRIFEIICHDNEYRLMAGARDALERWCRNAVANRDESFGNGRAMRNLFDDVIGAQADRIVESGRLDDPNALDQLEPEDFPED